MEQKRRKIKKGKEEKLENEEKPLKFVLGLPKWKFSTGKRHLTPGKNQENDFPPPLTNIPLLTLPDIRLSYTPRRMGHCFITPGTN